MRWLFAALSAAEARIRELEAHVGRLREALEPFARLATEVGLMQSHGPVDMRVSDLVMVRVVLASAPADSLERLRCLERIADENYADLLDQMDRTWGLWPNAGAAPEIGRPEINAFLESRFTHKPTTRLRERLRKLEAVMAAACDLRNQMREAYMRGDWPGVSFTAEIHLQKTLSALDAEVKGVQGFPPHNFQPYSPGVNSQVCSWCAGERDDPIHTDAEAKRNREG